MKKRRMSWAVLIRKVYEVDPLPCPECGGEMRSSVLSRNVRRMWLKKYGGTAGYGKKSPRGRRLQERRVAEGEPGHDYGFFDRVCI